MKWLTQLRAAFTKKVVKAPCARQTVQFGDIAFELSSLWRCQRGDAVVACGSNQRLRLVSTVALDGYGNANSTGTWLWTGQTNTTFYPTNQDQILAKANAEAAALLPPGAHVHSMDFYTALVVGAGGGCVAAAVVYADCSGAAAD